MARYNKAGSRSIKASDDQEVFRDLEKLIERAERAMSPWPEVDPDDIQVSTAKRRSHGNLGRFAELGMVVIIGAITIYGIATHDRDLLIRILTFAVMLLAGSVGLRWRPKGEKDGTGCDEQERSKSG